MFLKILLKKLNLTQRNLKQTRNAWQSLANSPLGTAVSPPSKLSSSETKPSCHLANVQRMHVVSVCLHYVHNLHIKRFHMVKRLRKSVQYIRRYSTIYASFWPCHTRRTQISPIITKFLDDVAQSSPLLTRTARRWYCNSFSIALVQRTQVVSVDVDNIS